MLVSGTLKKMTSSHEETIQYSLPVGEESIPLNQYLGKTLKIDFNGDILCLKCGKKTKKSFSQGYCYPCMQKTAACDMCILKPELCHYDQGTCREPEWGENHCLKPHIIYLANSSGIKVGITREVNQPTRWIDQGAIQALPIIKVQKRLDSGNIEVALKEHVADKTNWRKMLKGEVEETDLEAKWKELQQYVPEGIDLELLTDTASLSFQYPVLEYPTKISSLNFDKKPEIEGTLMGIKGQYLIFDIGVINVRKFSSYSIKFQS